ncbi:hypothetical protein CONCODRAFT_167570 [Conidiobolus coronatus NRRL 28638]|uniref:Uncharacterized protein n=1 Tax=Conidiobolus coronatus (strain ATCC 28846 / CBS 209.66 / NRRL 28638) TaxID=796925 RepID=A0A137PDZ9_CONC2|nr:hypothetical protein CONCODRAFT_167570 [Conidiobolus coronatus NRRL 28638]|eukprot:KXN73229.1 hypothetical protein CONCODRAFT_167570 [Conidiobolus coronatus NRRL 28638]
MVFTKEKSVFDIISAQDHFTSITLKFKTGFSHEICGINVFQFLQTFDCIITNEGDSDLKLCFNGIDLDDFEKNHCTIFYKGTDLFGDKEIKEFELSFNILKRFKIEDLWGEEIIEEEFFGKSFYHLDDYASTRRGLIPVFEKIDNEYIEDKMKKINFKFNNAIIEYNDFFENKYKNAFYNYDDDYLFFRDIYKQDRKTYGIDPWVFFKCQYCKYGKIEEIH